MRANGRARLRAAVGLAGWLVAGTLAAQNPPAAAPPNAPAPRATQLAGGGTAQYLVENPAVLQLNEIQVERIRKVSVKVDSLNAPVRARIQELTGGRPLREMPPVERRRIAPQMQRALQELRANNDRALDSIAVVLSPDQTSHLEALREDFKERLAERRAQSRAPRRRP